jgi:hypothetical protein
VSADIKADRVHISSHDGGMRDPGMRYAVHRLGQRYVPFRTISEAKAFVAEQYGPQKWTKTTVPDGRTNRTDYYPA